VSSQDLVGLPFRLVMLLLLAVGAVLVGHVGGRAASTAATASVRTVKIRHHPVARAAAHAHNHGEPRNVALYDDDEDDDDGDEGLAAPRAPDDDRDVTPAVIADGASARRVPPTGESTIAHADLGPSSGHPRPEEPPPRA
jgi:hypothetical protein